MLSGLYALTDSKYHAHDIWPDRVEKIIRAGASIIQLREKKIPDEKLLRHALVLKEICNHYDVLFIINDRIELAKKVNADGIHLGSTDLSLQQARQYLGNHFIIGASCYRRLYSALVAQKQGADYIAFGSVFPSRTKTNAKRCPLSVIYQATRCISIPVCAIGGINDKNAAYVVKAGADMLAVSDAIFNADDPAMMANKIHQQVIMPR